MMAQLSRRWAIATFRLTRREYFADFFITPPITVVLTVTTPFQVTA